MSKKAFIKPTKPSLVVGIIVTIFMFIFGIFFIYLLQDEPENHIGIGFLSIWLLVVLVIGGSFVYNYVNYDKNPSSSLAEEIQIGDFVKSNESDIGFDDKLRKLEVLKKENLISESEYLEKRKEIMSQSW